MFKFFRILLQTLEKLVAVIDDLTTAINTLGTTLNNIATAIGNLPTSGGATDAQLSALVTTVNGEISNAQAVLSKLTPTPPASGA